MLDRIIFLVGLPVSGIVSLGRRAARNLRIPFAELDQWIQERTGLTLEAIAEKTGEDGLRQVRMGAMSSLTGAGPGMIVPGEGAARIPEVRRIMRAWGSVILLDRPAELLFPDGEEAEAPAEPEAPAEGDTAAKREAAEALLEEYRALADVRIPYTGSADAAMLLLERVMKDRYHV